MGKGTHTKSRTRRQRFIVSGGRLARAARFLGQRGQSPLSRFANWGQPPFARFFILQFGPPQTAGSRDSPCTDKTINRAEGRSYEQFLSPFVPLACSRQSAILCSCVPIVYRLGRHPFKVQRRVRLPLGAPLQTRPPLAGGLLVWTSPAGDRTVQRRARLQPLPDGDDSQPVPASPPTPLLFGTTHKEQGRPPAPVLL